VNVPWPLVCHLLIPFPQDDKTPSGSVQKVFDPFFSAIKPVPQSAEKFDPLSFRKFMNDFGKAYHNQAMELIAICRLFSQVARQVPAQDADLTE
jgi:hypothetical protein